jgi:predicted aminopeptidase
MFGLGLALVSGCGSLGYYAQAGWGAVRLMGKARPIEALLRSQRLSPDLRRQLETAIEAREFAITELSLPDNGSYRQYADLGRPYAVWNVVAAPEFSLDPLIWCFPVAGCVTYRGYFSEARAQRYAVRLRRRDFDVSVKGVRAYSTLGHLRDPILNTFVDKPRPELAQMIFHELAHQVAYVIPVAWNRSEKKSGERKRRSPSC